MAKGKRSYLIDVIAAHTGGEPETFCIEDPITRERHELAASPKIGFSRAVQLRDGAIVRRSVRRGVSYLTISANPRSAPFITHEMKRVGRWELVTGKAFRVHSPQREDDAVLRLLRYARLDSSKLTIFDTSRELGSKVLDYTPNCLSTVRDDELTHVYREDESIMTSRWAVVRYRLSGGKGYGIRILVVKGLKSVVVLENLADAIAKACFGEKADRHLLFSWDWDWTATAEWISQKFHPRYDDERVDHFLYGDGLENILVVTERFPFSDPFESDEELLRMLRSRWGLKRFAARWGGKRHQEFADALDDAVRASSFVREHFHVWKMRFGEQFRVHVSTKEHASPDEAIDVQFLLDSRTKRPDQPGVLRSLLSVPGCIDLLGLNARELNREPFQERYAELFYAEGYLWGRLRRDSDSVPLALQSQVEEISWLLLDSETRDGHFASLNVAPVDDKKCRHGGWQFLSEGSGIIYGTFTQECDGEKVSDLKIFVRFPAEGDAKVLVVDCPDRCERTSNFYRIRGAIVSRDTDGHLRFAPYDTGETYRVFPTPWGMANTEFAVEKVQKKRTS